MESTVTQGLNLSIGILFLLCLAWIFYPMIQKALQDRAAIKKLGSMDERRTKLLSLIESGVIIAIHYGAERYRSENCDIESYFSVDGSDWTLWIAHKTDYPPSIDHTKIPESVREIFSNDFNDAVRLVKPILEQLKERNDGTRIVQLWKQEVGHGGTYDFGRIRPVKA